MYFEPLLSSTNTFIIVFLDEFFYHHETFLLMSGNAFYFYGIEYVEKAMAPHSSTLAWKIPWKEEPGGLQSMGWLRVGHD